MKVYGILRVLFVLTVATAQGADLCAPAALDTAAYRAANPDLRWYNGQQLCDHWTNHGAKEGRFASKFFNPGIYLLLNRDVAEATYTSCYDEQLAKWQESCSRGVCPRVNLDMNVPPCQKVKAVQHWLEYGLSEGRTPLLLADPRIFNSNVYLQKNPDLSPAGYTSETVINHWILFGIKEGRSASSEFDVRYYLDANPDVNNFVRSYCASNGYFGSLFDHVYDDAAACHNAIAVDHYLSHGIKEGRKGIQ
ncbi:MAG TPA: hypothetical protein PKY05_05960 [Fibrobacteria bacterium]|nr:hypothetical protein [Fibrobacteria bacterium]